MPKAFWIICGLIGLGAILFDARGFRINFRERLTWMVVGAAVVFSVVMIFFVK
jgi:hypothetical protein